MTAVAPTLLLLMMIKYLAVEVVVIVSRCGWLVVSDFAFSLPMCVSVCMCVGVSK